MRLYDLTEQYNDLIDILEQDPENEGLQAMLDGLEGKVDEKVDAILSVRNAKRAESKALRDEVKRLSDRAIQVDNEANKLEMMIENTMTRLGIDRLKTLKFTTWMQFNPPSVLVTDETAIPEHYFIPQPNKLDRRKLLEDIKEGIYARPDVASIKQEKSLRIK